MRLDDFLGLDSRRQELRYEFDKFAPVAMIGGMRDYLVMATTCEWLRGIELDGKGWRD